MKYTATALAAMAALGLAACANTEADETDERADATTSAADTMAADTDAMEKGELTAAIEGSWRTADDMARDTARNPGPTLAFFEVEADDTVIEIWPGGGWYTKILAPYLKAEGRYIAAGFDTEGSEYRANAMAKFNAEYVDNPDIYGDIEVTTLSAESGPLVAPGTADVVLTFRNVHNWMNGNFAEKAFNDFYAALKPGGILGVVEHRLPSSMAQDPTGRSGYVHEDYVIALATEAGFELVERSEINANPADTADHPFGVWTLPPVSRTTDRDGNTPEGFDPAAYTAIGESDRMTLKFRKPE